MNSFQGPLSPARALVHPLWLAALLVLATNDHLLKDSNLLPGPVTGKLSDFAGMLVAPALLATLLRVRTARALAACHVAVGAVFSAIQVARPAAEGWAALMAAVAVPWAITSDPTDLLALPMLPVSHRVLGAAMRAPAGRPLARFAQWAAAAVGLIFCTATSYAGNDFSGGLFLVNDSGETVTVRVQRLREEVAFDCDTIDETPGRLLSPSLFDLATVVELERGAIVALWQDASLTLTVGNVPPLVHQVPGGRPCEVLRVSVSGISQTFQVPLDAETYPTDVYSEDDIRSGRVPVVSIESDDGGLYLQPEAPVVAGEETAPPVAGAPGTCPAQSDADRLAWDFTNLAAARRIEAVEAGPDGCLRIDLRSQSAIDDGRPADRNYLCVPAETFPFAEGDWVRVDNLGAGVAVSAASPLGTPAPAPLEFLAIRSYIDGSFLELPSDLTVSARPDLTCGLTVYDTCDTVARPAEVEVTRPNLGGASTLAVGDTQTLDGSDGSTVEVTVLHALDRRVVDTECVVGPADVGFDLELVVVHRGPSP